MSFYLYVVHPGQPAIGNDYADPWAGAGPANLNRPRNTDVLRPIHIGMRSNKMGLPDPNLKNVRMFSNQVNTNRIVNPRMTNRRLLPQRNQNMPRITDHPDWRLADWQTDII